MDMRNVLGRLLILVAETLDRNLLTVPDIDEYEAPVTGLALQVPLAGMR
jgi:hypothetical protein